MKVVTTHLKGNLRKYQSLIFLKVGKTMQKSTEMDPNFKSDVEESKSENKQLDFAYYVMYTSKKLWVKCIHQNFMSMICFGKCKSTY